MISVILPTYNSGETITRSIRSILCQSYSDYEIIVLDDGSIDLTEKLVNNIQDPRIRYVKLPHQGLTATLNHGLSIAKHDIIARMDSDDLCVPWRFQKQLSALYTLPENVLLSSWYAVFENQSIKYVVTTPINSYMIKKGLILHSQISHPGLMCYKKILIDNGGYVNNVDVDAYQDYETWLKIKDKVEFCNLPEVLMFQQHREKSLSNNIDYKRETIYSIQKPFFENLYQSFYVLSEYEGNIYRGWREYFYGNKNYAREYWIKLKWHIFQYPRVCLAFLFTYLPREAFIQFTESRMRFRLNYFIQFYSKTNLSMRSIFRIMSSNQ